MTNKIMRRQMTYFAILILFVLAADPVFASSFLYKNRVTMSQDEPIEDDVYIFANFIKVNTPIRGDLSAFGFDVNAADEIDGNANLFGFRADLRGRVSRSARLFARTANISGEIQGNLLALGEEINFAEKAVVGRDLTAAGNNITIDGTVTGNLGAYGKRVVISGIIEGDVEVEAEELLIIPPANIKGELHYTSPDEAAIEEGVIIQGEKIWKLPEKKKGEEGFPILAILFKIALFFMALVTGFILIFLFKTHTIESSLKIETDFWSTLAIGFLTFLSCTIGAIILFILIAGIPLAIFLLCLGVVLIYVGKIYVAITAGRILIRWISRDAVPGIGWQLLLGLIVLAILFQTPFLGTAVYILSFILGMGAAVSGYLALVRRFKAAAEPSGIAGK